MRLHIAAIGFALVFLPVASADAALVTNTVSVTAGDIYRFVPTFLPPGSAPVDPVTLEFTITYDPTLDYVDNTANIVLNSLNLALSYPLAFSYDADPVTTFLGGDIPGGRLRVGGLHGADAFGTGADRVQFSPSTNDFWLYIDNFATTPAFVQLGYSQTASGPSNLYGTIVAELSDVTLAVTDVTAAVPEPSSLLLFAGFLAAGVLGRRRKRARFFDI